MSRFKIESYVTNSPASILKSFIDLLIKALNFSIFKGCFQGTYPKML